MKIKDKLTLISLKIAVAKKNAKKIKKIIENNEFNETLLDDELIKSIIEAGYLPNEHTPLIIKNGQNYLELFFSINYYHWESLDAFNEETLTPDIINKAIKNGYIITESSKPSITSNFEYVYAILKNTIHKYKYYGTEKIGDIIKTLSYCDRNIFLQVIKELSKENITLGPAILSKALNATEISKEIVIELMNYIKPFYINDFISKLDERYWTDEIISPAITRGLTFDKNTPKIILKNSQFVKTYIKESTQCDDILTICDISKLSEEEIDIIIMKIIASVEYDYENRYPFNIIKTCSSNNYNHLKWSKYIGWIRPELHEIELPEILGYSTLKEYFESQNIKYENNLTEQTQFVLDFIKFTDDTDVLSRIMSRCKIEILEDITKNHFDILKNKNIIVSKKLPKALLESKEYLELLITKSEEIDIIMAAIDSFDPSIISENLIRLAIKKGYYITYDSPKIIKTNVRYAWEIINKTDDIDIIISTIDALDQEYLTEAIVNEAIKKGYYITSKSPAKIKNNINYIKAIISTTEDINVINNTMNNCDYSLIDKELLNLAIQHGFICELPNMKEILEGPVRFAIVLSDKGMNIDTSYHDQKKRIVHKYISILEENKDLIEQIIIAQSKNRNPSSHIIRALQHLKEYVKNFDIFDYIKVLQDNDFCITANNHEQINELTMLDSEQIEYELSKIDNEHRQLIDFYLKNIGNSFAVYYEIDNLFSKEMFQNYTQTEIFKIYKYLFLIGKRINFKKIIEAGEIKKFKQIYESLYDSFDVENLYKYYQKYQKHYNFIKKIDLNTFSKEKIEQIKNVFRFNYSDIDLNEDNLDKYSELIYERNKKHMNNIDETKNTISLLLFQQEYSEVKSFYNYDLSYEKAIRLAQSIKNEDIRYILKKYAIILKFYKDKILNNNNFEDLKLMANSLNEQFARSSETFIDIHDLFSSMKDKILMIYGVELNEQLGIVQNQPETDNTIKKIGKYKSNNPMYLDRTEKVDYIEYNDEVYFLQHTMNAFGRGAKITDWKKPRLIGKAYICLSLVSNNIEGAEEDPANSIDNVTVLFNSFSPQNLKTFGSSDLYTYAESNSTVVKQRYKCQLDTLKNIAKHTTGNNHNEYTVLRENEDGQIMYPCGVKVVGDKPTQAEIDAAAYLGVPLIKLNRINTPNQTQVMEEIIDNIPSSPEINELEEQLTNLTTNQSHKR